MAPDVTYILCCFNQSSFVDVALESAITQDYPGKIEYVITDDGSTDGSVERIQDFIARHTSKAIRLIHDGANIGLTGRINQALRESSGELIILQACDDVAHPNRVDVFAEYFRNNPDSMVAFADVRRIDAAGGLISREHRAPLFREVAGDVNDPNNVRRFAIGCNEAFRRELIDRMGMLEEGERAAEDHQLIIMSLGAGGIAFLPIQTLDYRTHDANWCGAGRTANEAAFDWNRLRKSARSTLTNAEVALRLFARPVIRSSIGENRLRYLLLRAHREHHLHLLRWRAINPADHEPFWRIIPKCQPKASHIAFSVCLRLLGEAGGRLAWRLNALFKGKND
jgi:glycosyltransferase involved in cell wall biosynthesis